ncbi:hypothetical protein [Halotia branconii]|uniref:Uncharacterized protein n=1 Tax=Halotia branconii CENA392 TaxID=1539056 RepID=A0AAJ6P899_9CYAN|nr:hypothetical protein [Halotia branconii]WGV24417.1 hypothetical protein QI031_21920 [Halotia branconii CENA392]
MKTFYRISINKVTIEFNTSLGEGDWVSTVGGWRCDALLIPGAQLEALYYDGIKADTKSFTIESSIIRWSGSLKPKELLVRLSLTKDLPKLEEEKLQLEKDKLNLEKQKSSIETKWKVLTAIGAIVSSLLTLSTTYFVGQSKLATSLAPPRVHTYSSAMSIPENRCINSLTKSLENYGLQNVTTVNKGVYATKENYNIFVGCDTNTKAIFLVVSGPEDAEAKQIRENIKVLLPY